MDGDKFIFSEESSTTTLRTTKPWMADAKYFKEVQISASAAMKMVSHAVSGVEKGMADGGKPVEVMGLMLGHLKADNPNTLIVTDAFPLPVEGAETRVLADDQEVMNFMIDLGESLEQTRADRFMGWYHSHPFDVDVHSHCFLSSTDLSTQLGWQRAEDRNGNPWLAIVVDPLRSLAKGKPELGAFRAYPPEWNAPKDELPDGTIDTDDKSRVERWGSCWNRYHSIENYLWMSALSTTPVLEKENRERFAERVNGLTEKLHSTRSTLQRSHRTQNVGMNPELVGLSRDPLSRGGGSSSIEKGTQTSCVLSVEQMQAQLSQIAKHILFSSRTTYHQ